MLFFARLLLRIENLYRNDLRIGDTVSIINIFLFQTGKGFEWEGIISQAGYIYRLPMQLRFLRSCTFCRHQCCVQQ